MKGEKAINKETDKQGSKKDKKKDWLTAMGRKWKTHEQPAVLSHISRKRKKQL